MRHAIPLIALILAACWGESTEDPSGTVEPSTLAPQADPFERATPEELVPQIDSAYLDCDGDDWFVLAEVAGRADSMRAVLVRTEGEPLSFDLEMVPQPFAEGALWAPFHARRSDPGLMCEKADMAVLFEARDASGTLLDCVATGRNASALAAGDFDDRLERVAKGTWSGCRIR